MTLIDGDKIITVQLYDDEHEEYTEKKMSIIDFVDRFSDEGVTIADDIFNKMRAEILRNSYEGFELGEGFRDGYNTAMVKVLNILDKHKTESEGIRNEKDTFIFN